MPAPHPGIPKRVVLIRLPIAALLAACMAGIASAAAPPAEAQSERPTRPPRTLPDPPLERALDRAADSDLRFMTAMLAHHRQGMEMIRLAANRAVQPGLRVLVGRIRSNYEDESTMIRLWLRDRQGVRATNFERAALAPDRPGLLSDRPAVPTHPQMEALRHATGPAFDEQFLRLAIQHHAAGLQLVDDLLADPQGARDETVFRIVESLQGEQSAYVGHMRRMLGEAGTPQEQD